MSAAATAAGDNIIEHTVDARPTVASLLEGIML
jgi:hypothetical protein